MEKIKIKYFDNEIDKIEKISKGDLIDLRAAETVEMKKGDFKLIKLGVGMKLPEGYKANVYPRSSTYKNFGIILANSVGQIDNSYSGDKDEWRFPAIAMRDTIIHKNDRICQFEIQKIQPEIEFIEVEHLDEESRGIIKSNRNTIDVFKTVKIRALLQVYKKGGNDMNKKVLHFRLDEIRKMGLQVREKYNERKEDKKIASIGYRLLNLIKSGNKVDFMNDFFKIIVGFELIVPKSVINVMSERDFDFETFGYAFISGLLGEEDEDKKGNNDQKINENKQNGQ